MKTWTFIDKTQWPERGPWDSEPDKAQWTDEATGFTCLAVRARSHWCGYVGVPPGHWVHGKGYDEVDVDVHGGLTFAGGCQHNEREQGVCHIPEPGQPDSLWWLGFDCAHCGDKRPATDTRILDIERMFPLGHDSETYRTLEYVQYETTALAMQLAEPKQ